MFTAVASFNIVLQIALWALIIGFGIWASKHVQLRSLVWLGAYALLSIPLAFLAQYNLQQIVSGHVIPFGLTAGEFVAQFFLWSKCVSSIANLIIAILILSDATFLLSKSGVELDWKPARQVLKARSQSTALGMASIFLMLAAPISALVLRL